MSNDFDKIKSDFKNLNIVCIDDNENSLFLIETICCDMNLNVTSFLDPLEALMYVIKNSVDMILIDYMMPNLNGIEFIKEYRKTNEIIPIIMITALGENEEIHKEAFDVGVNDFVSKPVNSVLLKARITSLLTSYQYSLLIQDKAKLLEKEVNEKTRELKVLNENLEQKVKDEIEKNRQKDLLLQQQNRLSAMGEMISNIAHQWRQPLSAITSTISGLKLKEEIGILEKEDISNANVSILNNARFLSNTIDSFRNFFKDNQRNNQFFVYKVINETISIVKASYDNNFIIINKNFDETINYFGNENLLSQVILNILTNAKDVFETIHSEEKKIKISLFSDDLTITIEVKDNAGGIPEDIIGKIFDPYFTTKHQSQGTGLGLYMSTQIIKTHFKGFIEVENFEEENEKGACFKIIFPKV